MTALDLGCGPGYFSMEMAKLVGKSGKVVAADIQDGMLNILKMKIQRQKPGYNIVLHKCPEDRIGLSETFDFILMFYMLHEIQNPEIFLRELRSILGNDGKILIVEPRFHVSRKNFAESIRMIRAAGFDTLDEPKIFFSWSIVIKKSETTGD